MASRTVPFVEPQASTVSSASFGPCRKYAAPGVSPSPQGRACHALVHHRDAQSHALGDVAVGIVLVGGRPEATPFTRPAARGDPVVGEGVAQVLFTFARSSL